MQQADGAGVRIVGAERVGTYQFAELTARVRRGHSPRPHLMQHDRDPAVRHLPSGFAAGEATADDVHRALLQRRHGGAVLQEGDQPRAGAPKQTRLKRRRDAGTTPNV